MIIHVFFFFFNDTATTEIYTLSLHDALPIFGNGRMCDFYFDGVYWEMDGMDRSSDYFEAKYGDLPFVVVTPRSEEHTSELQSRQYLVCRLLLEKKKRIKRSDIVEDQYIN